MAMTKKTSMTTTTTTTAKKPAAAAKPAAMKVAVAAKAAAKKLAAAAKAAAKKPAAAAKPAAMKVAVAAKAAAKKLAAATKPAATVKPAAAKPAAAKKPAAAAAKKPTTPAAAQSQILFPGQLEIATPGGPVVEDLPLQSALPVNTHFAALLTAADLRPHLYVAHRALDGLLVTVLAYVEAAALGGKAGAGLRIPQQGAWLSSPSDGVIFVVASPRRLSYEEIVELIKGRAGAPIKGDDTNV